MKDFRLDNNDNIEENMSYNPELGNQKVFGSDNERQKRLNNERPRYQRGVPAQYRSSDSANRMEDTAEHTVTAGEPVTNERKIRQAPQVNLSGRTPMPANNQQGNMYRQTNSAPNGGEYGVSQRSDLQNTQHRPAMPLYNQYSTMQNVQKQTPHTESPQSAPRANQPFMQKQNISVQPSKTNLSENISEKNTVINQRAPEPPMAQRTPVQPYRQGPVQGQAPSPMQTPSSVQPKTSPASYNQDVNANINNEIYNGNEKNNGMYPPYGYNQSNYMQNGTLPTNSNAEPINSGALNQNAGNIPMQGGYAEYNTAFLENSTAPGQNSNRNKKKTKNKGLIIVFVIIGLIFLGLVGTLIGLSYRVLNDRYNNNGPTINSDTVTSDNAWGIGDNTDITDPNNSGLDINNQPDINANEYSAQHAFEVLSPSVVGISCFENTLTEVDEGPVGEGTGIIVTSDGYIATNSHVIGDSKTAYKVYVTLSNGDESEAKIVGFDTKTDLAVLKINKTSLTPAQFADSENLSIGQDVVAIGNPGGSEYANSITKGIISAVNRSVSTYSYVNYIQTDAAINPGNSGGPLANLYGQVIGINTIKIVDNEYEGMGFAIPSVTVKSICDDLITQGYVSDRVRIGITGQELSAAAASAHNLSGGILIIGFSNDSPFKGTQAKAEDIITKFNGVEVTSFSELYKELDKYKPGDEVKVTLYRASNTGTTGRTFDVTIKLLADLGETQNTEKVE